MKTSILKSISLACLVLFASISTVSASDINIIKISNPVSSNGIQIGDVLNRTLNIEVDSAYQLPKTSLPMKGESRNGIELREVGVQMTKRNEKNIYTIALSYQVFSSAAKPVIMSLPDEHIALIGGDKALSIDIPEWKFWYSPLVAEGIANAKENLQPQSKPALMNLKIHETRLWISIGLAISGLLGLIYVNADKRWLPFMGGAFAQAHRNIKKLKGSHANNINAFKYLHEAFNAIYGSNVFETDLDKFLASHQKFQKLSVEIKDFFEQSNKALFAGQYENNALNLHGLILLSKRLRDCERGV